MKSFGEWLVEIGKLIALLAFFGFLIVLPVIELAFDIEVFGGFVTNLRLMAQGFVLAVVMMAVGAVLKGVATESPSIKEAWQQGVAEDIAKNGPVLSLKEAWAQGVAEGKAKAEAKKAAKEAAKQSN